ncbi:uncharacterized protein LOC144627513 isoform X2 [Crassostrea virginica]
MTNKSETAVKHAYPVGTQMVWIAALTTVVYILVGLFGFFIFKKRKRKTSLLDQEQLNEHESKKEKEMSFNMEQSKDFLSTGVVDIYHARGIIVGCAGAGKTTLLRRLRGVPLNEHAKIEHTEIVDVHANSFEVIDDTIKGIDENEKGPIVTFSIEEVVNNKNKKQTEIQIEDGKERAEADMSSTGESGQSLTSLETQSGENNLTHDSKQSLKQSQIQKQSHESIEQTGLTVNDSDNSNSKDTTIKDYSVEELTDYVKKISKEDAKKERITFLDFAGQSMYYAFHQIYLSPETFYILVVDIRKRFESACETKEICGSRFASWKYKDYYKFWLKSIDSFSDTHTPVIIVGTHAEGKSEEECKQFFEDFFKLFENRVDLRRHLHHDRCFAIKLPTDGGKIEELTEIKSKICNLVKLLPCWKKTVRPVWALIENILQQNRDKIIISRNELSDHNRHLPPEFRISKNQMTQLLNYLHRVGTLLYFEEEDLNDTIILDVQWFVDAFKCILEYPIGFEETHDMERSQFFTTGELDDKYLDLIWSKSKRYKEYQEHKKVLMSYMEKLGLLAVCDSGIQRWYYFPCMNERKFNMEHAGLNKHVSSSILCFQFDEAKQLPLFLFYNLVVKFFNMPGWTSLPGENRNKQRSCVFDEVACFTFKDHIVAMCICYFQIQVQVFSPCQTLTIKLSVLREIRASLEKYIKEFKNHPSVIGYKCEKGKFHDEHDAGFIPENKFPLKDGDRLCKNCIIQEAHMVDNIVCWGKPRMPNGNSDTHLVIGNIKEVTDEGLVSIKHILRASLDGNVENFRYHLEHEIGSKKYLLKLTDECGWNVMHCAARGGNLKIFEIILLDMVPGIFEGTEKTYEQMTLLHIASKYGHYNICEIVLKRFQQILTATSFHGKNACHFAAEGGYIDILELLVKNNVDALAKTNNGQNIFHIACSYNKLEMCRFISEKFFALLSLECTEGWNATLYAAKNSDTKVLEFLKEKQISFEHCSTTNRNALHVACDNGNVDACMFLIKHYPFLLDLVDQKGRNAGHFAVRKGNLTILKELENNMNVKTPTNDGMNILHMACLHGHVEMCQYILKKYPSLNLDKTEKGWTTAHFVSGIGNNKGNEREIFEIIFTAAERVNITALTKKGNSVLTLAIKYNDLNFAEYLLEYHFHLLNIQGVNDPRKTGNEDPKMKTLLDKFLPESPR